MEKDTTFLISEKINRSLREKYNPDSSKLRRDQLKLLSMLEVIDGICRENDIQYWLSSGTLLGCARHGGFIPWDDDMDIFMLRKDYRKIDKLLRKYDSPLYVFHTRHTDPDYVNLFGKFREKNGRIHSSSPRYKYYKYAGIGLDIFPVEKTSYLAAKISGITYNKVMQSTLFISNQVIRHLYTRALECLFACFFFPLMRLLGLINLNNEFHLALGIGWPEQTVHLKHTFPLKNAFFEGKPFPVPNNIDEYLTSFYGDWKKLPSEERIMSSIHCQEYKEEINKNEQVKA